MDALIEMKCPFHLKPHQIQGLELNSLPLFPIVQWLVKSVIDYRRITGDTVRNYSRFLFDSSTSNLEGNHLDQKAKDSGRQFLIHSVPKEEAVCRRLLSPATGSGTESELQSVSPMRCGKERGTECEI